ncbi:hypothetical protein AB0910_19415 [Streptomyces sp. NPDC047002]|uniref:hypothetical protein n=1 Tax=Streptomyces sp. NPDC047002 TaxID=3155475 RepID=UPI0034565949
MTTSAPMIVKDPRALLEPEQFADVRATVLDANPGMTEDIAGRITAQALAFVATAAAHPGASIAPSPVVDEGWHALVLHTQLYAELCERLCNGFVHHVPERPDGSEYDPDLTTRTMLTMASAGYPVDVELWRGPDQSTITVGALTWHTPNGPNCTPIIITPKPKPKGMAPE